MSAVGETKFVSFYLHIVCIAITQNSYPYPLLKIDNLSDEEGGGLKSFIPPGVFNAVIPNAHAVDAVKVSISLFILKLGLIN